MKRLLFIGALSGAGAKAAHSQTIETITAQLIQLKLFNRSTVSGYHLMSNGLDSIGTIDGNEYVLHANYFHTLDAPNPNFGVDPEKIKRLNNLILEIKALLYDEASPSAKPVGRIALSR
jgi:hypothetical protein